MTKAIGRSHAAASFLILATFVAGAFVIRSTPAMADDKYGCRGDQACVRIAEKTKCDALCQHACREIRRDLEACYANFGPKFEFEKAKLIAAGKRGPFTVRYSY